MIARPIFPDPDREYAMQYVDYASSAVPDDYLCARCAARGCKLWRPSYEEAPLLCARCAGSAAGVSVDGIDERGIRKEGPWPTDQIGEYLPAIPEDSRKGYWYYVRIPEDAMNWWECLPTLPTHAA